MFYLGKYLYIACLQHDGQRQNLSNAIDRFEAPEGRP
jgi:hypothetical protein